MTKRTTQEWQTIMDNHAKSNLTTAEFCRQHNIHAQSLYAKRHAMGLSKPMKKENAVIKSPPSFIKANVVNTSSSVVLQTRHAQLSFSTSCDPLWVAALLNGLAA